MNELENTQIAITSSNREHVSITPNRMKKNIKCLLLAYELGYRCDETGSVISPRSKSLKLYPNNHGYLHFSIRLNLETHYRLISRAIPVHRLQAYQKFGDDLFAPKIHVRHLNGKCDDNSYNNIEIGSASDNMMDKTKETRLHCAICASNRIRRFTDLEIENIKTFHDEIKSYKKTMEKFNISSKGALHYLLNIKYQTNKI
jgi:hypothetical protein